MPLPHTIVLPAEWVRAQRPGDWLTAQELTVLNAWPSETRRAEWLAGRLAAKRLLLEEFDLKPREWSVGRDGVAPALTGCDLPNLVLSLSHSEGMGAATLSDRLTEGSAGIDLQHIRAVHPGLCARVFGPDERAQIAALFGTEDDPAGMLLFWALKEAAIKARRLPWGRSLQSIAIWLERPGVGEVVMKGEALMNAHYERLGDWWLARAVKPELTT